MVVSGLTMVYLVGFLLDVRGYWVPFTVDAVALVFVVLILVLTLRWWDPQAGPTPRPHVRVFLALAGLAFLTQVIGVLVELGDPGDLANNAPGLLLLGVLLLNCLS